MTALETTISTSTENPGAITVKDNNGVEHTYIPTPKTANELIVIPEGTIIRHFNIAALQGQTVFGSKVTAAIQVDGTNVYVGYAFCSRHDQYNRKTGLRIALQRLEQTPFQLGLQTEPRRQHALHCAAATLEFASTTGIDLPGMPKHWKHLSTTLDPFGLTRVLTAMGV